MKHLYSFLTIGCIALAILYAMTISSYKVFSYIGIDQADAFIYTAFTVKVVVFLISAFIILLYKGEDTNTQTHTGDTPQ